MILSLLVLFLVVITVEAITQMIIDGDIFTELRGWLSRKSNFISRLLGCGYCFSMWPSMVLAWSVPMDVTGYLLIDIVVKTFVVHRLSNWFHELMSRWLNRHPKTCVVHNIGENNDKKRSK